MNIEELIARLIELKDYKDPEFGWSDAEVRHVLADEALLEYINDPRVTEAFNNIERWYA